MTSKSPKELAAGLSRFSGKVALVTAATKGIGLAIADRFGSEGAKLFICSRGQKNVDETVSALKAKGYTVAGISCHVGDPKQRKLFIAEAVKLYGKIDVLVSNAAVNPVFGTMIENTDEKSWDKVFDINVKSSYFLIADAVPHMNPNSSILIVSSYAGFVPSNLLGAYSVSKTALLGLVKVLAKDLAGRKIRVNGLCPGVIKTKFSEALWKDGGDQDGKTLQDAVMGRFGEPEECGSVAAFLCSKDASYITGENIAVTGGVQSRL